MKRFENYVCDLSTPNICDVTSRTHRANNNVLKPLQYATDLDHRANNRLPLQPIRQLSEINAPQPLEHPLFRGVKSEF